MFRSTVRSAVLGTGCLLWAAATACAQDHGAHVQPVGMSGMGGMAGVNPANPIIAPDTRVAIELSGEERTFVLGEMRAFLESVEGIVNGVAAGDMTVVSEAARRSSMMAMQNAPRTLMGKMPPEFRMLGMDTHAKFGALADAASGMGDKTAILKQLGAVLANCGACHQGYRFVAK